MSYIFFGFLALCVLGLAGMFLAFCYNQDKLKASMKCKMEIKDTASEVSIDIEKDDKKGNNQ